MKRYVLSRAAQRDLDEIWNYTAHRWSPAQANNYIEHIRSACEKLGRSEVRGRSIDDVRPRYWKLAVKSHFLFYRVEESGVIDIVRILHHAWISRRICRPLALLPSARRLDST